MHKQSSFRPFARAAAGTRVGAVCARILGIVQRARVRAASAAVVFGVLVAISTVNAVQIDIYGNLGSVAFGTSVAVVPNGNIVIIDPNAT